nr:hypothetical protein [Tanacetum cinerariifolium]
MLSSESRRVGGFQGRFVGRDAGVDALVEATVVQHDVGLDLRHVFGFGLLAVVGHGGIERGVVHRELVGQPAAPAEAHAAGAAVAVGPGAQVGEGGQVIMQVFGGVELADERAAL